MEHLGGGGIAQSSVFFRGRVIDEAAVVHAAQGAAPTHVALGHGADFRPAKGGAPTGPLGVIVVGMAAAGGEGGVGGHHGEVFRAVVIADELHGKGGAGILAVAVIGAGGGMVAVGDRALIDEGAEKVMGAGDGGIDFGMLDAEFFGEGDEEKAAVAGGVESAIAGVHFVELAAIKRRKGEGVPPGARFALTHGGFDGVFAQRGHDVVVAGGIVVDRAVKADEAVVPGLVAFVALVAGLEHRADGLGGRLPRAVGAAHPLFDEFAVFGLAGGDEPHGLDDAAFAASRFFRIYDEALLQGLPCVFEDLLGLGAIVGSGIGVVGEGAQFQLHFEGDGIEGEFIEIHVFDLFLAGFLGFPIVEGIVAFGFVDELVDVGSGDVFGTGAGGVVFIAPDLEGDFAGVHLAFGFDDGVADGEAEVAAGLEFHTVDAGDDIAGEEFAIGGRAFDGALDEELVAHSSAGHDAGNAGGAEMPGHRLVLRGWQAFALGEVGEVIGADGFLHDIAPVLDGGLLFLGDLAFVGEEEGGKREEEEDGFHGRAAVQRSREKPV